MVIQVINLANSIVGVSVLAMPFCFKTCGIFLATLMLIICAIITRIVCHFLIKAGTMTKRRTYELLAYQAFGNGGKFMVEVTIIGFLLGTLIALLVALGDLGPQVIAETFNLENNDSLRTITMAAMALFVALPLGLLRSIDSLGSVSTLSFLFYLFLVLKIFLEGFESLASEGMEKLNYWRPAGLFQCIPIIAMALSCQTQIFVIYDSLPDPSVQKMNDVVKKAVYVCTTFYFCVGFFGYVGFANEGFTGNILMSLRNSWSTQFIKFCFVLSIAFSVPLCVFPCRASFHSLLFRMNSMHHSFHDISATYIPDGRLRFLTVSIIGISLITALLIPNIELVLGLVGSTAGSIICLIFPSAMFIRVTSKKTTERLLAQFILAISICMMVLTTYTTLYAVERAQGNQDVLISKEIEVPVAKLSSEDLHVDEKLHSPDFVPFEPKQEPMQKKIEEKKLDHKPEKISESDIKVNSESKKIQPEQVIPPVSPVKANNPSLKSKDPKEIKIKKGIKVPEKKLVDTENKVEKAKPAGNVPEVSPLVPVAVPVMKNPAEDAIKEPLQKEKPVMKPKDSISVDAAVVESKDANVQKIDSVIKAVEAEVPKKAEIEKSL